MANKVLGLVVFLALGAVSASALADESQPTADAPVTTLKPITVVGRTQLPIVIELKRLSAAHEAGVAHEALHRALLAQSLPQGLRPQAK
jgi:hypothetical protein